MMYLLLFSVLAIGFYAAAAVSVQIAANDRQAADAQAAAESGLALMTLELHRIALPASTADSDSLAAIAKKLGGRFGGSQSPRGDATASAGTLSVPGADAFIPLDLQAGDQFRAELSMNGSSLLVKVTGRGSNAAIVRTIQEEFARQPATERAPLPTAANESVQFMAMPNTYEEVAR